MPPVKRPLRGHPDRGCQHSTGHDLTVVPGVLFPPVSTSGRGGQAVCTAMKTCDFCGRQETDETKTLTWSTAVENGRSKTYCDQCSREHLRAMEGKLDSEYW